MSEKTKQELIRIRDVFNRDVNEVIKSFDPEYVWVNICQELGMVANPYCPGVVQERFLKGEEPTDICTFHKKPGPEIIMVPDNMTVPAMVKKFGYPIMIAPVFIPTAGIEINLDEDLFIRRQLNRIIKKLCGNNDRFMGFGNWEPFTLKRVHRPYLRDNSGDFELDEFNPVWIDTLDRRIGQRRERQMSSTVVLIDNCSTHVRVPGAWNAHPWNGDNNINGTSNWKPSIYHFYESQHQNVPGIQETAKYIEAYVRFLVRRLDKKYRPFIHWEITNEGQAGHGYNKIIRGWLREEGVKDNWRVQTSLNHSHLSSYKKQMNHFLSYSIHGINTWEKYKAAKRLVQSGVRFLPSEDGEEPTWPVGFYKDMVYRMLKDGALGAEFNERPWWYDNVFDPDLYDWHRILMIGLGWQKFLDESG